VNSQYDSRTIVHSRRNHNHRWKTKIAYSSCNAVDMVEFLDDASSSRVCKDERCDWTDFASDIHCCWRWVSFCSVAMSTPRSATRPRRRDISSAHTLCLHLTELVSIINVVRPNENTLYYCDEISCWLSVIVCNSQLCSNLAQILLIISTYHIAVVVLSMSA